MVAASPSRTLSVFTEGVNRGCGGLAVPHVSKPESILLQWDVVFRYDHRWEELGLLSPSMVFGLSLSAICCFVCLSVFIVPPSNVGLPAVGGILPLLLCGVILLCQHFLKVANYIKSKDEILFWMILKAFIVLNELLLLFFVTLQTLVLPRGSLFDLNA